MMTQVVVQVEVAEQTFHWASLNHVVHQREQSLAAMEVAAVLSVVSRHLARVAPARSQFMELVPY